MLGGLDALFHHPYEKPWSHATADVYSQGATAFHLDVKHTMSSTGLTAESRHSTILYCSVVTTITNYMKEAGTQHLPKALFTSTGQTGVSSRAGTVRHERGWGGGDSKKKRGADGTRTHDPLHAMQVL